MPSSQPEASSTRRYVLLALKISVSVALLAVLFSRIDVGRLWAGARNASLLWLRAALALYLIKVLASIWRWHLLLRAQHVAIRRRSLLETFLIACFFNNFLPSNIGGDVIRIRDTARPAGSKTLAATVVLVDRGLGLMGLVLVAALSATVLAGSHRGAMQIWPSWLWVCFLIVDAASTQEVVSHV